MSAIEDASIAGEGLPSVTVRPDEESAPHDAAAVEVPVTVRIDITENVRTVVGSVRVDGNASVPEPELVGVLGLVAGRPFFLTQMAIDRDAIQQHYANLGFQSATVDTNPGLSPDRTRADVRLHRPRGPRIFVDHVTSSSATCGRRPRRSSASSSSSPVIRSGWRR